MTAAITRKREPAHVVVADDNAQVRAVLARAMQSLGYRVTAVSNGEEALEEASSGVDLMVLDVQMPHLSGFEVAARIRKMDRGVTIPILMITANAGHAERMEALRVGANDFIAKPFDFAELRLRCGWLLTLKEAHDTIARHNAILEAAVQDRTAALQKALEQAKASAAAVEAAHLDTIRRLTVAAEYRDHDTALHIRRIGAFAQQLALAAGWSPARARCLYHAAQMHDVGKVGVPDGILLKPGPLDADERRLMEQHTTFGHEILRGSPSKLLQLGAEIAYAHHERWDGGGYPLGLIGEDIPIAARITAIVDFYDALTSDRPYRRACSSEETLALMRAERGRHFDPALLDVFLDNIAGFPSGDGEDGFEAPIRVRT